MNKITIPEIHIYSILKNILQLIKKDFKDNTDEKNTVLYKIFGDQRIGDFIYFEQAKDLFLRDLDHPRKINVSLFFNREKSTLPTIHLNLPSETPGPTDSLGMGIGNQDNIVNKVEGTVTEVYERSFDSTYNLIITSSNPFETLLLYHTFKALLISVYDSLEFQGLRMPKFGGQDLQLNESLIPNNVMVRTLTLNVFYETAIPKYISDKLINSLQFDGKIVE